VRGSISWLPSARPMGEQLPGVFLEDPMSRGFSAGLDPMLAPVFLTLDCLETYLDPRLAPLDFLPWLASWMGVELDETLPPARRRAIVDSAGALQPVYGTRAGLVRILELVTGAPVEVRESGGVRWSAAPGADPPGDPEPALDIIVRVPDPTGRAGENMRERVERVVREVRPAHLPFRVQVLPRE